MYSSLEQFQEYLGLDVLEANQDELLESFLNTANAKLNHLCGVDSFDLGTYNQTIEDRGISETPRGLEFYLKNKPVQSIDEINGQSAGTKGSDYMIIYDRRAIFKNLKLNDWGMIDVEYTAGYETIPDDLKIMEMMIASGMRQEHSNEGVSEYKLGDETIKFGSRTGNYGTMSPDDQYFSFTALLNKYKSFNLPL